MLFHPFGLPPRIRHHKLPAFLSIVSKHYELFLPASITTLASSGSVPINHHCPTSSPLATHNFTQLFNSTSFSFAPHPIGYGKISNQYSYFGRWLWPQLGPIEWLSVRFYLRLSIFVLRSCTQYFLEQPLKACLFNVNIHMHSSF